MLDEAKLDLDGLVLERKEEQRALASTSRTTSDRADTELEAFLTLHQFRFLSDGKNATEFIGRGPSR